MSNIEDVLASEAASAEAKRDATPGPGIRAQRRAGAGNPAVLSVRLTKGQYDQLSERAAAVGVPTSALARDILLASLAAPSGRSDDLLASKLEEVLRRTLSPDVLAS